MTLGYPRNFTVFGLKGQGNRVSMCIFHTNVWSLTQKQMIPKCSNLVYGMTLGYPRNDMFWGFQSHRLELGLALTAIRRGFELYVCLLV